MPKYYQGILRDTEYILTPSTYLGKLVGLASAKLVHILEKDTI